MEAYQIVAAVFAALAVLCFVVAIGFDEDEGKDEMDEDAVRQRLASIAAQ